MRLNPIFILALVTLAGCLEPKAEPSGQIVVVGNGAEWANTLVVDLKKEDHVESLVADKNLDLEPVLSKLGQTDAPSKLDWVAIDFENKETVVQVKSPEATVYGRDAKKSETLRKEDLEKLSISSEIAPKFLSNGGMLFFSPEMSLRYSPDHKTSILLVDKALSYLVDKKSQLFVQTGKNKWVVVSLNDIAKKKEDYSNDEWRDLNTINADILYQTKSGRIFGYSLNRPTVLREFLEDFDQKEIKWQVSQPQFTDILPEKMVVVGEQAFVPLHSVNFFRASWSIGVVDVDGVHLLPLKAENSADLLLIGGQQTFAFRESFDSNEIQICDFLNPRFPCAAADLPMGLHKVAFGEGDKLMIAYEDAAGTLPKIARLETNLASPDFGKPMVEKFLDFKVESLRFFSLPDFYRQN